MDFQIRIECCSDSTREIKIMLILGLAMFVFNGHVALSERLDDQYFCPGNHPQKTLDVDKIMGIWYVREIVDHKQEENMARGYVTLHMCPTLFLAQETRSDYRLVWTENALAVFYKIKLTNWDNPGYWVASGPHNGSVPGPFEGHFTGTIQVMKAVEDHMALTFCTRSTTDTQIFSVVLDRDRRLSRPDIRGVNSMLLRRGLKPLFVKQTCNGSSQRFQALLCQLLVILLWRCF